MFSKTPNPKLSPTLGATFHGGSGDETAVHDDLSPQVKVPLMARAADLSQVVVTQRVPCTDMVECRVSILGITIMT